MQPKAEARRLRALDGLRGYAALIVVIHHTLLLAPPLAALYDPGAADPTPGWVQVLARSPLRIFWAGGEAVCLFFVLSGFVLTLPFLGRRADWLGYYPRRLARLYLPVWAALLLSLLAFYSVTRIRQDGLGYWVNEHVFAYSVSTFLGDISLASPSFLNSPLWSLKYEVEFSLALPLYVWAALRVRRHAGLGIVLCLAVIAVGTRLVVGEFVYLPMFGVGALLAVLHHEGRLVRLTPSTTLRWTSFGLAAVGLLVASWWVPFLPATAANAVTTCGAGMIVVAYIAWPVASRSGTSPVGQWLGQRSFSLYLTHEPVLVSLAFLLPDWPRWTVAAVAFPSALAVGSIFFRWVEGPSHRLSRRLGQRVASRALAVLIGEVGQPGDGC